MLSRVFQENIMAKNGYIKKRPCRICKKWYLPDPRAKNTQKTCGNKECQKKWHAKKCGQWNKKNRSYFQNHHLQKKLQAAAQQSPSPEIPPPAVKPAQSPQLPQEVIQGVIGVQHYIIIEYVARVLLRSFKEVIDKQYAEFSAIAEQVPSTGVLRGDSPSKPP